MLAPAAPPTRLLDRFGRVAQSLRVSLTDRCNLRCVYCMPAGGTAGLPAERLLSKEELLRLIRVAVEMLGITRVRFTGGEPLMRRDLREIVSGVAQLRTCNGVAPEISLTTNGIGLDKRVERLARAGLTRVNISLDAVDADIYRRVTRRDRYDAVLRSLVAVEKAGLPIKVNAVVMPGLNDSQILPLAHFCLERGYVLRFIEEMPLGAGGEWTRASMVTAAVVLETLMSHFEIKPAGHRGSAPAEEWVVNGSDCHRSGCIGFIASVTRPFCAACDRSRLTADGQLRTCLFSRTETDLRQALRGGATDAALAELWAGANLLKDAGGAIESTGSVRPNRSMSQIGG